MRIDGVKILFRTFERSGMEVEEGVLADLDGSLTLFWVRMPWDKIEIDGKANPMIHTKLEPAAVIHDSKEFDFDDATLISARACVQAAFDEHWNTD